VQDFVEPLVMVLLKLSHQRLDVGFADLGPSETVAQKRVEYIFTGLVFVVQSKPNQVPLRLRKPGALVLRRRVH
jgi:hypothetical protein